MPRICGLVALDIPAEIVAELALERSANVADMFSGKPACRKPASARETRP